jgi:glycine hydroxymethyltransferase
MNKSKTNKNLKIVDPQILELIKREEKRQSTVLEMIPSENFASQAVLEASSSVLSNKYAEGYPGKRYYQGNKEIDKIESLAIERCKKLFKVPFANVQAYSGSPANTAIMFALLEKDEKIMGLALSSGGHLTHGHPNVTFSGRYFKSVQYIVEENGTIDYDKLEALVLTEKPKMLIAGTTAYSRILDFKRFAQIADKVGAILLADISHVIGMVISKNHPSPIPFAHIIMSTTHKTLLRPP